MSEENQQQPQPQLRQKKRGRPRNAADRLDNLQIQVSEEIGRIATEEVISAARAVRLPIFSKIVQAKKKAEQIQDNLLEELIESSIAVLHETKQKALSGVNEWLENFVGDKERLLALTPSGAKTLLSIAYTADQMYRLGIGKSTSNVAVAHSTASEKSKLDAAVEKLQEIDPVFDYSKYKAVGMTQAELLPEGSDEEVRVLESGEGGEAGAGGDRDSGEDGAARSNDGGALSPDSDSAQEAPTLGAGDDSESTVQGQQEDNSSAARTEHGED